MSNNKQSSVEWLFGQFLLYPLPQDKTELFKGDWADIFEQAKAMHKEEIKNAFVSGEISWGFEGEAEQYYNETFEGNNENI